VTRVQPMLQRKDLDLLQEAGTPQDAAQWGPSWEAQAGKGTLLAGCLAAPWSPPPGLWL
jgi:hypothetical protein